MNGRLELMMHRWLPWVAVGGLVLAGLALLMRETIHGHLFSLFSPEEPVQGPTSVDARVVKDSLRTAVREVSQVITVLDSNPRTQRAVAEIVGRKDRDFVLEVWVVDSVGTIVFSGRNRPIWPRVDVLVPPSLSRLLDGIPAELLPPSERTVLMTAGAIQRGYEFSREILAKWRDFDPSHPEVSELDDEVLRRGWMTLWGEWRDFDFDHQVPSEDMVRNLVETRLRMLRSYPARWSDRWVVLHPVPGGLIAAVGDNAKNLPHLPFGFERPTNEHPYLLSGALVLFCAGVAAYWFSLPAWVVTDARRRGEKAVVWGLFALLGNVVALVLYLLVRREV